MKRIISGVLACLLAVMVFPFASLPLKASAAEETQASPIADGDYTPQVVEVTGKTDTWDGTVASGYESGSGTESDPYIIATAEQLAYFAQRGSNSGVYHLAINVDLAGREWTPKATFSGTFDGMGHQITGFVQTRLTNNCVGFFCQLNGAVRNLRIVSAKITINSSVSSGSVGILAGKSDSSAVTNVLVSGNISVTDTSMEAQVGGLLGTAGGYVQKCSFDGTVYARVERVYAGGLIGVSTGTVSSSFSKGKVTAETVYDSFFLGGLIGQANGTITNSYSQVEVVGVADWYQCSAGLVADSGATISYCYASGNVSATASGEKNVSAGGLVGDADGGGISNSFSYNQRIESWIKGAATSTVREAKAGRLAGSSSVGVTNSYAWSGTAIQRSGHQTHDNGCKDDTYSHPTWTSASCTAETGTISSLDDSFLFSTLGWSRSTWALSLGTMPTLQWEKNHDVTVRLVKDGKVIGVTYASMTNDSVYNYTPPSIYGYNVASVSESIYGDKEYELTYVKKADCVLNVECRSTTTGELLDTGVNNRGVFGSNYTVNAPAIKGYEPASETVTVYMDATSKTVAVNYTPKTIPVRVTHEFYNDDGEKIDAKTQVAETTVLYDGNIYVTPLTDDQTIGYSPDRTEPLLIDGRTAYDNQQSGFYNVTFRYNTQTVAYKIRCVDEAGNALAEAEYKLQEGSPISIGAGLDEGVAGNYNLPKIPGYVCEYSLTEDALTDKTIVVTYNKKAYDVYVVYEIDGEKTSERYVGTYFFGDTCTLTLPEQYREGYGYSGFDANYQRPILINKDEEYIITVVLQDHGCVVGVDFVYETGEAVDTSIAGHIEKGVKHGDRLTFMVPSIENYSAYLNGKKIEGNLVTTDVIQENCTLTIEYRRNLYSADSWGVCGDTMVWYFYEGGLLKLVGSGDMYDYSSETAPWYQYRMEIREVQMADGITSVGAYAFDGCETLTTIVLPNEVAIIGERAFKDCKHVQNITLPRNLARIGEAAFVGCRNLTQFVLPDENNEYVLYGGALYHVSTNTLIAYPAAARPGGSFALLEGTIHIAPYAFYGCTRIYSLDRSSFETVTSIGAYAFAGCSGLSTVELPSSVKEIGDYAFADAMCSKVIIYGNLTYLGTGAFDGYHSRLRVYFKGDAPAFTGEHVFGEAGDKIYVYYPSGNEDWANQIAYEKTDDMKYPYWQGYLAYGHSNINSVSVYSGNESVYAIFVMCDKTPIRDVTVTLGGVSEKTDSDGFVVFVIPSSATDTTLFVSKELYQSPIYNVTSAYQLKTSGVDYLSLETAEKETVTGVSCFGNDISSKTGYINNKNAGSIPITVKANTAFDIKSVKLVQKYIDPKTGEEGVKELDRVESIGEKMDEAGYCHFLVEAAQFSYKKGTDLPVMTILETTSGADPVVSVLNIEVISFTVSADFSNLLGGYDLDLGELGCGFLQGVKIKFSNEAMPHIPIGYKMVNNEFYITLNLENEEVLGDALDQARKSTEYRMTEFMNRGTTATDKKLQKKGEKETTAKFEIKPELCAAIGFVVGPDDEILKITSYMMLKVEFKASWETTIPTAFIPIALGAELSLEGGIGVSDAFGYDFQADEPLRLENFRLELAGGIRLEVGVGIATDLASASLGVYGKCRLEGVFLIGQATECESLLFSASLGIYFKLKVGPFGVGYDIEILSGEWSLIPKKTYNLLRARDATGYAGTCNGISVYDLTNYGIASDAPQLKPEDVEWGEDIAIVMEEGAYQYAEPSIINCDGVYVAIYLGLDADRTALNAQCVMCRIYDNDAGAWSEPFAIDPDGTADSDYSVQYFDGKIYVAYTEENCVFDGDIADGESLIIEMALAQDVSVSVLNPQTASVEQTLSVTTDGVYDFSPVLQSIDETLYLAWVSNSGADQNAVFGANDCNNVWVRALENGEWQTSTCVLSDCYTVSQLCIGEQSGAPCIALIIDEDSDFATAGDSNVYVVDMTGDIQFVDCDGKNVGDIRYVTAGSLDTFIFSSNGELLLLGEDASLSVFREANDVINNYKLLDLTDDVMMLAWMETGLENESGAEISKIKFALRFSDGEWSDVFELMTASHRMMSFDAVAQNGNVQLVYVSSLIQLQEEGTLTYSRMCSDFFNMDYSLLVEVSDLTYDSVGNTISSTATVTNTGLKEIKQLAAMVAELDSATKKPIRYYPIGLFKVDIGYGEYESVSMTTAMREEWALGECEVVFVVFDGNIEEFETFVEEENGKLNNPESGSGSISGGNESWGSGSVDSETASGSATEKDDRPDYSVVGEHIIVGNAEYLSLKVTKTGYERHGVISKVPNRLKVYRVNGEERELLYTEEITINSRGEMQFFLIELQKDFFVETDETFECVIEINDTDTDPDNNSVTIRALKPENAAGTVFDKMVIASELSTYFGTFDKYEGEDLTLDIIPNGHDFRGVDTMDEEPISVTAAADGDVLHAVISREELMRFDLGDHELRFLFLTENGFVDCIFNLSVVDSTPIPMQGVVTVVGKAERGEALSAEVVGAETTDLTYEWIVDGNVVSTDETYVVGSDVLGKSLIVRVSGTGLYYGFLESEPVYVQKLARTLGTLKLASADDESVSLKKMFFVGNGTMYFGYATVNDASAVTNWQENSSFVLPQRGTYYFFAKVVDSATYQDAYTEGLAYSYLYDRALCVAGSTLSIQSDISINYYVNASAAEGYDRIYVSFVREKHLDDGTTVEVVTTVTEYSVRQSGKYFVFSFDGIAAKEMGDVIRAVVYAEKDGKVYCGGTDVYSVATYAYNIIANSADEEMVALAINILNYGASAQRYFKYNELNLVNEDLTEDQKAMAHNPVEVASVKDFLPGANANLYFEGASLLMEEKVAIKYYFNAGEYLKTHDDLSELQLVITYGEKTVVLNSDAFVHSKDTIYYVVLDALAAKDMRVTCYATFYTDYMGEHEIEQSETMLYSIESYAHSKIGSNNEALVAMIKAMLIYGDSAKAYTK